MQRLGQSADAGWALCVALYIVTSSARLCFSCAARLARRASVILYRHKRHGNDRPSRNCLSRVTASWCESKKENSEEAPQDEPATRPASLMTIFMHDGRGGRAKQSAGLAALVRLCGCPGTAGSGHAGFKLATTRSVPLCDTKALGLLLKLRRAERTQRGRKGKKA